MRVLLWLLLLAQADSFDSTFRAGLAALQQNDLARAREQLESASQMDPRRAHVWLALARVYWKQHETGLAGSAAEKTEQLAAGDPVGLHGLGGDLLEHNQLQDAIQLLEGSRTIFARSPQLELTLGVAYYGMRRFSDAVDAFLRVTRIDPAVEQPYVFLGRMIEQTEDKLR